jgi:hypothetical protein
MSAGDERDSRLSEFARQLSDRMDDLKRETPAPVLQLINGARREPQLSDAELFAVRRMLADFEKIATCCPTARHLLDRD